MGDRNKLEGRWKVRKGSGRDDSKIRGKTTSRNEAAFAR